jgi:HPt (histidine-containing phosphotransfer) domain-containing protein
MFEWRKPGDEPPVLDTGYLARLAAHLGADLTAELLADGMIDLADRLGRLGELAAAGDAEAIARLGHDLVGMCGHLGLTRLSVAAADLNRSARQGMAGVAPIAARVARLGAEAAGAMRVHLDQEGASREKGRPDA